MIALSEFVFCLSPMAIPTTAEFNQNKYAQSIPYEHLYEIEEKPNKNTMEYNTWTADDLVKDQNAKILKRINELEIQQEDHK